MPKSTQPHTLKCSLKVSECTLKIQARRAQGPGCSAESVAFVQKDDAFRSQQGLFPRIPQIIWSILPNVTIVFQMLLVSP